MADASRTIIDLNQRLLNSIAQGDWKAYVELCDPSLTCFEPEARGHLVEGLDFHQYYFDLGPSKSAVQTTMASPHVRMLGESAAVICYIRLVQKLLADGSPTTAHVEETRIWQKIGSSWKHVHFHRVPLA